MKSRTCFVFDDVVVVLDVVVDVVAVVAADDAAK